MVLGSHATVRLWSLSGGESVGVRGDGDDGVRYAVAMMARLSVHSLVLPRD
jgi:hypothetical protein